MNYRIKKIFLLSILSFFGSIILSVADSHVTECTITGGIFDKTQPIDNGYCASAPDTYEVIAYEMYPVSYTHLTLPTTPYV